MLLYCDIIVQRKNLFLSKILVIFLTQTTVNCKMFFPEKVKMETFLWICPSVMIFLRDFFLVSARFIFYLYYTHVNIEDFIVF